MTIARDASGKVLGQVTAVRAGQPLRVPGWSTPARDSRTDQVTLLTRDGRYVTVPAHTVRLEEIR